MASTGSPTARSNTRSTALPARSPKTRPTAPPPSSSKTCWTGCSKRASPCSANPHHAATRSTGPTRKPGHDHHPRTPPPPPRPPARTTAPPEDHHGSQTAENTTEQPPAKPDCADPEGSWGHRRGNHPGQKDEALYGYCLQLGRGPGLVAG